MNFPAVRIEGSVLSADVLEEIATGQKKNGQSPADFGLDSGTKVKDDIAEAWGAARTYWAAFQLRLTKLKEGDPGTTPTRENWMVPLFEFLGYDLQVQQKGEEINRRTYPISHRGSARKDFPVHIAGWGDSLDKKRESGTGLRMSPHALVQEYLNLTEHLYALVTNGRTLRLLRDSSRLVRLSYVEFDLQRIFEEELFADFALLFRILHATRMPMDVESAAESLVEVYHQDSLESGSRIREGLSAAVAEAIPTIANGFLAHPDNDALREAKSEDKWRDGQTTMRQPGFDKEFHGALLRLIYRILFLLVIEERGLVHIKGTDSRMRGVYRDHLSIARLRRLAEKRRYREEYNSDGWDALLSTFQLYEDGDKGSPLGIAPLGGLFDDRAIGMLAKCRLSNAFLFAAFRGLGFFEHPKTKAKIRTNYGALNVEEFGSVYEGLLAVEAQVTETHEGYGDWHYDFQDSDARASSGSHYTPEELVQPLIKHSLDYLIEDRLKEDDPEKAILSLTVCDVACGSGHILLSAARRIAEALACHRTGEDQPNPDALRTALRDVIRHCIYGVDLNPLAVELCKVALWLEAHAPGEPLGFLDHKIKCGNAIVGLSRQEELQRGIPDEAFKTLPGDDKDIAAAFRKTNKAERKERATGQEQLPLASELHEKLDAVLARTREIAALPEHSPAETAAKEERYAVSRSQDTFLLSQIAAIPIAQFYQPKTAGNKANLITDATFRHYLSGRAPQGQATASAMAVAKRRKTFHWFLEFPEVIADGGFDCILGNPPYLGGQALSGTYGHGFCEYVRWQYTPTGLSELIAFFLRRIFSLLTPNGFTAFITTNSITDGDVRKDGLEQVILGGGCINMAVRGIRWPGVANLVVSLVSIHRGAWKDKCSLDGEPVKLINAYFEDSEDAGEPYRVRENAKRVFQGSIFLGDGFLLTHREADSLIEKSSKNSKVVSPLINGQEINNKPDQAPGRSIINFQDWPEQKAKTYAEPFVIVEEKVKPVRAKSNRPARRDRWWQYAERATGLYTGIVGQCRCFAAARTTKHLNFSAAPTDRVFTDALYVFTTDRWDHYAVVQSTVHEIWARKYSGALKQDLRYSPSKCFDTFAFPVGQWQQTNPALASIGKRYHEHRRNVMLRLWGGLTEVYNLFHARDLEDLLDKLFKKRAKSEDWIDKVPEEHRSLAGSLSHEQARDAILELRNLHCGLDLAVLTAYGWHQSGPGGPTLDLAHDFHEVETLPENDRVRYTIHPDARKEVLKRLLLLNHQRYAEEVAQGLHDKKTKKKAAKKAAQRNKTPDELI